LTMSRKEPSPSVILAEGIREDVLSRNLGHIFGPNATFSVETTKTGASPPLEEPRFLLTYSEQAQAYVIKKAGSDVAARILVWIFSLGAKCLLADGVRNIGYRPGSKSRLSQGR
jgi:hypothetical protein